MLCSRRSHLRFRQDHLRARLIHRLLSRCHCCPGLIYLVDGDKLLGKQRFDAMEIVGRIQQFCFCTIQFGLGAGHIGLCLVDGCRCAIDIRSSTVGIRSSRPDRTLLRCDRPSLVHNLALECVPIGSRSLQSIFIRPRIDLEEQSTLLDKCVVLHRERTDRAINLRSDADEIGEYLCVVGARIPAWSRLSPRDP